MAEDRPPPSDLLDKIKRKALELGFQAVGVVSPQALTAEGALLRQWLDRGYHADMAWMARYLDKRMDPRALMPQAQSIIVALMSYAPRPDDAPGPGALKIARYARGDDYHRVIKRRLKELLKAIQQWEPKAEGRAFTDSAPVLEKALAVRAGLGWLGKNGLVIHPDLGSYCFIGELFLNLDLSGDEAAPTPNHCGRCTRCLDACPTQAIVAPEVVDANRCIAYWTIEHQGEVIAPGIAARLEGWAFGCDICQEVCPWNARAEKIAASGSACAPDIEPAFLPRPWNVAPQADELLALTPEVFAERYRHSPIKRTGLAALQRNVRAIVSTEPSQ
ncbi:MAG: tRNA epoxyqueuosine(34) reductase QueG [Vampirovibrionales bacterium]|nr:tRNA epoxyqueuosine(34) reductase QueG [Vampirovibrionales bacterium]